MKKHIRLMPALLGLTAINMAAISVVSAQKAQAITVQDVTRGCPYGAYYHLVWDGWEADILLSAQGSGTLFGSNYQRFPIRYTLYNPQDIVSGYSGPGYRGVNTTGTYRIVFWVDFNNTPSNPNDDQRYDGYVMTQTKNAIAGITWWANQPFGFYAKFTNCNQG